MSTSSWNDSHEAGSSFQLDMGVGGVVRVDVMRAVTSDGRHIEEVLLELSGQRVSDSRLDSVMVALSLEDASTVRGAIGAAVEYIQKQRMEGK